MQMDLGSVILLGNSQTFVGIIATLVILCIARNTNNFIYEVLSDIKCEIVEYTKELKPTVSLDSVKLVLIISQFFCIRRTKNIKNRMLNCMKNVRLLSCR